MATPKKIIAQDLELADEEIARLRKENKKLKEQIEKLTDEFMSRWGYDPIVLEQLEKEKDTYRDKLTQITNMYNEKVIEIEKLKAQIAEYDDLTEELDYRKREAKRLGWSSKKS